MTKQTESHYRKKYLDLVDEFGVKEKQWAEVDQRLRRILALLLVVAEGPSSPEISATLTAIRDGLKGGLDLSAIEERLEPLKKRVLEETKWAERSEALPPVHQILIHVVERLPLPPDMAEAAVEVVESLEAGVSPDRLPDAIDDVAGLVYRVRRRMQEEKRELEALLLEVTGRLQELAGGLSEAHQEVDAGFASSRSLIEALGEEVRGLEARSREATDPDALRAAVRTSLQSIQRHLEVKRKEDDDREAKLRREVDALRQTVGELEQEVSEYREKTRQAREASLRDPLTGCYNRLAYEERARTEVARWKRYASHLSLVVFDLDHFKKINDSFGHKAGDQVLKAFAQIAATQLREVDFFARYGGEEFVALLPETPLEAAVTVGEKVRGAVESFRFHSRGRRVLITLSCGVAQFGGGDTLESTFDRADKALYAAKGQGRNRTMTEKEIGSG